MEPIALPLDLFLSSTMLRQTKDPKKLSCISTNDAIRDVSDFYFDDEVWAIRYLMANTGRRGANCRHGGVRLTERQLQQTPEAPLRCQRGSPGVVETRARPGLYPNLIRGGQRAELHLAGTVAAVRVSRGSVAQKSCCPRAGSAAQPTCLIWRLWRAPARCRAPAFR